MTISVAKQIPIYRPYLTGNEKVYVNKCLDTSWISSKGEFIELFEKEFSNFTGAEYCTSVFNGTVALHLGLLALGIGPGDEVIVPTLTYVASVNTIVQAGAVPVFVDSLKDSLQIDCDDVVAKITDKTKAVMAVHLYGLPCDMDKLTKICKNYNLKLVEDCAEAFGTLYKGKHVGTFGDVGTFSFFGNKTITTGEGGMVTAREASVIAKAAHLKNQGVSRTIEYHHDVLGYNYRLTNIGAAIGLAQLEKADEILEKKRQLAKWYKEYLTGLPLSFHDELPNTKHSYWMCTIIVNESKDRNLLRDHLKAVGVETRPLFPTCNKFPHLYTDQVFYMAEDLSSKGINLPSFPALTCEEVKFICKEIKNYFKQESS